MAEGDSQANSGDDDRAFGDTSIRAVLTHVFADIDEAVIVSDAQRRIVLVNRAALELFGYDETELVGENARRIYADAGEYERHGRERFNSAAAAEHSSYLARYRRADGSVFDAETIAGPVRDPARDTLMFLAIIRDVTERLSVQKTLHALHGIASDQRLSSAQRRHTILELGCAHFDMPVGFVSRVEPAHGEFVDVVDPAQRFVAGALYDLHDTACARIIEHAAPVVLAASPAGAADPVWFGDRQFARYIGCPVQVGDTCFGTLNFASPVHGDGYNDADLDLLGLFAQWIGQELRMAENIEALRLAHDQLSRTASLDELTGLGNRRLMTRQLDHELERGRRQNSAVSLALVDFDRFKQLNDTRGHAAGDAALRLFARLADDTLRASDQVARWGGEEFLVLLPDTEIDAAVGAIERLLDAVRSTPLACRGDAVMLTASAGVVVTDCHESPESVIERADQALYRAKSEGRDRAVRG